MLRPFLFAAGAAARPMSSAAPAWDLVAATIVERLPVVQREAPQWEAAYRLEMEELAAAGGNLPAPPSKDDDDASASSKASSAKLPPVAPRDVADAVGVDSDDSETDADPSNDGKKAKKKKKKQ